MDIRMQDEGSLVILFPMSAKGDDWLKANLDENGPRWVHGYVVERQFVNPILGGMYEAGLKVRV